MKVLTYIYSQNRQTIAFQESAKRHGYELINVCPRPGEFGGNNTVMQSLYRALCELKGSNELIVYADGGDSLFVDKIYAPSDRIIYSAEKACYPYPKWAEKHPESKTPWRYLNGGGWMGPVDLILEYWEKYGLSTYTDPRTEYAQAAQQLAFFNAYADGFPVEMDTHCVWFQTLAFAEPDDFEVFDIDNTIRKACLYNTVTKTNPSLLHGNGRTDMEHIYNAFGYE